MKKALIVIAVLVVLVAVGVYFLLSNLNSIVAKAIEKHGSDVTQTSVSVSGVEIKLRDGRGSIKGLHVANPEGFRARDAFSLGDITVDIDIQSVRENPIVIDEVRIQAPVVYAEVTKTGATNINELRKRVQAATSGSTGKGAESGGPAKRIRIKEFVFEKGSIEVDASALGVEKRTIALPEIRLSDVGGTRGAPPNEIARVVLNTLAEKAASEVADSEVNRLIEDQLGGSLQDKAKELLDKIGK